MFLPSFESGGLFPYSWTSSFRVTMPPELIFKAPSPRSLNVVLSKYPTPSTILTEAEVHPQVSYWTAFLLLEVDGLLTFVVAFTPLNALFLNIVVNWFESRKFFSPGLTLKVDPYEINWWFVAPSVPTNNIALLLMNYDGSNTTSVRTTSFPCASKNGVVFTLVSVGIIFPSISLTLLSELRITSTSLRTPSFSVFSNGD